MRRFLQQAAGTFSLAAAAAHGLLTPAHFDEWWGYGLLFLAASVAQAVLGLALLTDAFRERDGSWRPGGRRLEVAVQWAGLLGTLLLIALYVATRTVGVPAGPEAGAVEEVALLDVVTKLFEVAVVVLLAMLLARRSRDDAASA